MITSARLNAPAILLAIAGLTVLYPPAATAATIQIVNLDGPNEGFNDPTPVSPIGGNPGTTLGDQRMNVFLEAAALWGAQIESSQTIWIAASFDDLICTQSSAVLGASSAVAVVKDFPEELFPGTWHPVALANARAGLDFSPGGNDIVISFNSELGVDPQCLCKDILCTDTYGWYYGLNHAEGENFDLLAVTLHEIAHGLGFAEYVSRDSGALLQGSPDVYTHFVFDKTLGLHWSEMSNGQRLASLTNDGNVMWSGTEVAAAAPDLESAGINTELDPDLFYPRLYAPPSVAEGSSISHFDQSGTWIPEIGLELPDPDQLMEPSITILSPVTGDFALSLADELMADVGWPGAPVAPAVCGNDTTEGTEACDGTDVNGSSCAALGCTGGNLACAVDCSDFDTSACSGCPAPVCDNDGICELGEDCDNCPSDCVGGVMSGAVCGNGICEAADGEDCLTCAQDCNGKQNGKPSDRFCCGDGDGTNPVPCSDSLCSDGGVACTDTPAPTGTYCCGDLVPACSADAETCSNCALDCTVGTGEVCGTGIDEDCDGAVDCDDTDCSGEPACNEPPPSCVPTSSKEKGLKKCTDGEDNDCDGAVDAADPDCAP